MRTFKIIIISLVFYVAGVIITYELLRLWDWLFKSDFWRIIFSIITLLGSVKYFWEHTEWTIRNLKK